MRSSAAFLFALVAFAALSQVEGQVGSTGAVGCVNNCTGHGSCQEGTCYCDRGYGGPDCNTWGCENRCMGHGVCYDPRYNASVSVATCGCEAGWTGEDCSTRTLRGGRGVRSWCGAASVSLSARAGER